MSEINENAGSIANEEVNVNETGAEAAKAKEVVVESAGEMAAEEQPILKEKKEKKVKAEVSAAAAVTPEEFDWDSYEKDGFLSKRSRADQEKQYEETLSTVAVDEVVDGTVISMNNREVVINIGQKSEGVVSLNEFRYNPDLKVGDKVEVYVESQEDKKGQLEAAFMAYRRIQAACRLSI